MTRHLLIALLLAAPALPVAADALPPELRVQVRDDAPRGQPFVLRAEIQDPDGVYAPTVFYRVDGAGEFETVELILKASGRYEATLPSLWGTRLEYFVEAFDREGNGPARQGHPEAPLWLRLTDDAPADARLVTAGPPPAAPFYKTWWFWTVTGVAVVGAGVAIAVASSGEDTVRLRAVGAP